MLNAFQDPQSVQGYHNEYLNLIKYYMNTKRPSTFVRYYNIDLDNSSYDEHLEATYDMYNITNIKFNIYDFTPSFYISPVVNATANVPDMRGQMMDSTTSIVVYTVTPRIHDVIMFYGPIKSGEIFRVTNMRTPVNAIHTDANLTWFELDLEYAPITEAKNLKILNHYVYDLSQESYITYDNYQKFINNISVYENILNQLNVYYDTYYDLYQYNNIVPIEVNEVIIFFKRMYAIKYKRLLEDYLFPYGYLDIFNDQMFYNTIEDTPYMVWNYTYHTYDLAAKSVNEYTWSVTQKTPETELDKMFLLSYQLLQAAFDWGEKDTI